MDAARPVIIILLTCITVSIHICTALPAATVGRARLKLFSRALASLRGDQREAYGIYGYKSI
jgi:hypothetical protein